MFEIEEPYYNTKQNLVKERHSYANQLAGGLNNHREATIKITIKEETKEVKTSKAADWLDNFFFNLMSKKLRRRIDKWAFDRIGFSHLSLDDIKKRIKIEVQRESDGFDVFED